MACATLPALPLSDPTFALCSNQLPLFALSHMYIYATRKIQARRFLVRSRPCKSASLPSLSLSGPWNPRGRRGAHPRVRIPGQSLRSPLSLPQHAGTSAASGPTRRLNDPLWLRNLRQLKQGESINFEGFTPYWQPACNPALLCTRNAS